MKRLFLILAFALFSCSATEDDSTTTEQCYRVVSIVDNPNGDYILVNVNGQTVQFNVVNAFNYRINQMICNLNDII